MLTKKALKAHLIELEQQLIEELTTMQDSYKSSMDLDEEDTLDPEDFSHQDEWGQSAHDLEVRIEKARRELKKLEKMPLDVHDTISVGSVVITQDIGFVIGVASPTFTHNGLRFVGISDQAPIYAVMKGLKAGDRFTFGNHTYKITQIL